MAGFLKGKVFRPLLCWIVISTGLLALRHHQQQERKATILFAVSVEGRTGQPPYEAELNQLHFEAGKHSGLGQKKLTIRANDTDPFVTNVFVWYGGKNLGNITLPRRRGTLDLSVIPHALRVEVTNREANRVLYNAARESITLPTGSYQVTARFARFTMERTIEIAPHRIERLVIDPGITALALDSQPTNAEFELNSVMPPDISVRSNTPVTITDLPSGQYELRIWQGDYQKTVPLKLNARQSTNQLSVQFDYGKLTINSDPSNATIHTSEKMLGQTPAVLTLPTGLIRLAVRKEGFQTTNLTLTLQVNEERSVELTLLSMGYITAMEQARDLASGFSPDLDRAIDEVNKALQIRPGDQAALQLKQAIAFNKHLLDARQFRRDREFAKALTEVESALEFNTTDTDALALKRELEKELQSFLQAVAEGRRALPQKIFEETEANFPHKDLFPAQTMQFTGELATVRARIVERLSGNPAWNIGRNEVVDQDVVLVQAAIRSFGIRQNTLLVIGQTAENEVTVHFKLWIYTLSNKVQITLGGVSDDSFVPLHSSSPAIGAIGAEGRRNRYLEEFKKRIQE
jgi:hypothetical protein